MPSYVCINEHHFITEINRKYRIAQILDINRITDTTLSNVLVFSDFDSEIEKYVESKFFKTKLHMLRSASQMGLIRARMFGARHATGNYLPSESRSVFSRALMKKQRGHEPTVLRLHGSTMLLIKHACLCFAELCSAKYSSFKTVDEISFNQCLCEQFEISNHDFELLLMKQNSLFTMKRVHHSVFTQTKNCYIARNQNAVTFLLFVCCAWALISMYFICSEGRRDF